MRKSTETPRLLASATRTLLFGVISPFSYLRMAWWLGRPPSASDSLRSEKPARFRASSRRCPFMIQSSSAEVDIFAYDITYVNCDWPRGGSDESGCYKRASRKWSPHFARSRATCGCAPSMSVPATMPTPHVFARMLALYVEWPCDSGSRRCCSRMMTEQQPPTLHRCRDCPNKPMLSMKTGTIMEGSKLGYRTRAIAVYLVATNLKSVSGMNLHRDLGVTQKSAWHLAHRIRKEMVRSKAPAPDRSRHHTAHPTSGQGARTPGGSLSCTPEVPPLKPVE